MIIFNHLACPYKVYTFFTVGGSEDQESRITHSTAQSVMDVSEDLFFTPALASNTQMRPCYRCSLQLHLEAPPTLTLLSFTCTHPSLSSTSPHPFLLHLPSPLSPPPPHPSLCPPPALTPLSLTALCWPLLTCSHTLC